MIATHKLYRSLDRLREDLIAYPGNYICPPMRNFRAHLTVYAALSRREFDEAVN